MNGFENLLILMVVVYAAGKLFRALSLPVIFGELLGGILVGPLVFNIVDPGDHTIIMLAELGIFFLMLHAGLETDPKQLMKASKKAFLIAISGMLLPFGLVFILAKAFQYNTNEAIFLGLGLSMTAIAITVRVFKDYRASQTLAAQTAVSGAIATDILAMMAFALILNIFETGDVNLIGVGIIFIKILAFFAVVIWGGLRLSKHSNKLLKNKGFTFSLIVALTLGLIAEKLGLHMIIGAFLAGLFIREEVVDKKVFEKIEDRIYGISYSFLGPIFFTTLAFHLDFSALITGTGVLLILLVTGMIGKTLGATLAAITQKIKIKTAIVVGVAMNSKGAIDLVIASVALEKGLIGNDVFSILVAFAFISTFITIFALKPLIKMSKD